MLIVALISSVLLGFIRGGSLKPIAQLEMKGLWFYILAILLQGLVLTGVIPPSLSAGLAYSVSFLLLLMGSFLDRHVHGMQWIMLGLFLNGLVVAANGGKMPVMVPEASLPHDAQALTHSPLTELTRMGFLSDVIRFPLFGEHYLLLSAGDLLISLGVFAAIQKLMVSRPGEE
ncbi:MAG: DUF5317 domain-containing protein [Betaproteobacteria bacterium]